jgi:hypothetical protein
LLEKSGQQIIQTAETKAVGLAYSDRYHMVSYILHGFRFNVRALLAASFTALMMEAVRTSEMSVKIYLKTLNFILGAERT